MHPAEPMPVTPPATVRLSSALLFGVAGLTLLGAVLDLVFTNTGLSVYRDSYTGETGSGFASVAGATFDLLVAAGVSILAILNRHGRKNARITTLVLGGIFLFCGGFATMTNGLHRPAGYFVETGSTTLARTLPAAYGISAGVLDILVVLAGLAALILLVVPPSNRYFHARLLMRAQQILGPAYPPMQHQTGYNPYITPTPPPYGSPTPPPFSFPPQPEPSPHTGSMPAIDPWAEPTEK
ncbi:hypothetical protein [Winogradskya consettensis]|nr:hypothetical protein [Actinoplanes consettensis]